MWGKETLPVRWFGPRQARAQEKTPHHCCAYTPRLRVPTHRYVVLGYNRSFDQTKRKTFCFNHRERPQDPFPSSGVSVQLGCVQKNRRDAMSIARQSRNGRSADILVRQFLPHRLADKNVRAPALLCFVRSPRASWAIAVQRKERRRGRSRQSPFSDEYADGQR